MFKKICFALFLFFLILLMIGILLTEFSTKTFYLISLAILIFGILLYPTNFSFQTKRDILMLPMVVVLLFSIVNLLFFQKYVDGLLLINILMGSLGFVFYSKEKKLIGKKWK